MTLKNSSGNPFIIKGPQILYGSATPAYNDHIQIQPVQDPDPFHNTFRSSFPLHKSRVQNDLQIWIAPQGNVTDILHCSPCWCSHNSQALYKSGNLLLVFLSKHAHLFQFLLQKQKSAIQITCSFQSDLPGIHLIPAITLININSTGYHNLISILHTECQAFSLTCKHHTGKGAGLILQGKIDMSAGMVLTVGYFSLNLKLLKEVILGKHITHIAVYLSYRVYIIHSPAYQEYRSQKNLRLPRQSAWPVPLPH